MYNLKARVYPASLCIFPFLIFYYFYLRNDFVDFFIFYGKFIKTIGDISIPVLAIYLYSQIGRFVGKYVFEKIIYKDELEMPTTKYLLYSDDKYSKEYKEKIRNKISNDFSMNLLSQEEEIKNLLMAKKKIIEAVGLIRGKVKSGKLLLQHNIEYGFFRNLIGGSVISLIISLCNAYFFNSVYVNIIAFRLSMVFTVLYLLPIFFSKKIINNLGNSYSEFMYKEYLID